MGPLWILYRPSIYFSSIKVINDFIEPFVERAIAQSKEEYEKKDKPGNTINLTDALSQFTKDRNLLRDHIASTIVAARDTTAACLSWLFFELSYHPEIYIKLMEEVLNTIGQNGRPTYEDLKGMKYMQNCLNEGILLFLTQLY
jgi:cytochrome P450